MKAKLHLLLLFFALAVKAQVGVNTTTPNSQLDIRSSNQATPANTDGILIPKVDAFPVVNPTAAQQGMLVYLTMAAGPKLPGFYYWDNPTVSWIGLGSSTPDADWYEVATSTAPDNISDDMFHLGRVAIGKNTTAFPLEIANSAYDFNIYSVNSNSTNGSSKIGFSNSMSGNSDNNQMAILNMVSGTGIGLHFGTQNILTGSGIGVHYGVASTLSGTGDGNMIGTYNELLNSGNGIHYGTYSLLSGGGTNPHYGVYSVLSGSGTGAQTGVYSVISNSNNVQQIGTNNVLSGTGTASHIGTQNELSAGSGAQSGVFNNLSATTASFHRATYNLLSGGGAGDRIGNYSSVTGAGTGLQAGNYNLISNSGGGIHYGEYNFLNGAGAGNKYGTYTLIDPASGGTGYGIYSETLKAGSYAGYFRGAVTIGTTAANTYTLPSSRGTNLQIMQTDGTGNVGWRDVTVALNNTAWLTTGNTGLAATNFIGTTDGIPLIFRSANTERMRINAADGEIVAGATASPYPGDLFATVSTAALTFGVNGYTSQNGSGVWGETLSGASNFSSVQGVYSGSGVGSGAFGNYNGTNTSNTRAGVSGYNATAPGNGGAGVYGYYGGGNTLTNQHMGVLGAYIGSTYGIGIYGIGFGGGIITGNTDAAVVGWRQNNANYSGYFNGNHVIANGTKSASVGTSKGNQLLYVTETPGVWFEDIGRGKLVNGTIEIKLDPLFLETVAIDDAHPMSVFLQEEGDSNGLYVIPGKDGFVVKEKNGGTSNISFSYRIMAKRLNFQDHRFGNDPVWGAGDTRKYNQYATPPPVDYNENVRFQEEQRRNYKPTPMPAGFVTYEQIQSEAKKLETQKPKPAQPVK